MGSYIAVATCMTEHFVREIIAFEFRSRNVGGHWSYDFFFSERDVYMYVSINKCFDVYGIK